MKKISVLIPSYNEEENIVPITESVLALFNTEFPSYDYEIVIIDNFSTDNTRALIRELCAKNTKIKAIFNTRNFGPANSGFYGFCQTTGDCVIPLVADFQAPVELIPAFVREWEAGYKFIAAIKTNSEESKIMWLIRTIYYKILRRFSNTDLLDHFMGFGLYDKCIVDAIKRLDDPVPFFKGMLLGLGYERKEIPYLQPKRRAGTSSYNFLRYYSEAMLAFTSYTNTGLRMVTIFGFICAGISFCIATVYLIFKLLNWSTFTLGMAPAVIGIFFLGSLQLFSIGFIGEYIMAINARLMKRPLVVEEERINFNN
jgi:glycosyltransferase involved in cell wall biosynthesis